MAKSHVDSEKDAQQSDTLLARRRLLKIGAYVPPLVLGMMIAAPYSASAGNNNPKAGVGNGLSCAPCSCAPCGQAGADNVKKCQKKKDQCNPKNAKQGQGQ
ncbi:MAG: hypothetical protein R8M38_10375 [Mariprofundaceae bacterium]